MIANLCLLLAPVFGPSTTIQDPQPAPAPQPAPTPPPEEVKPVHEEAPPPPKEEPPPPKEEPRPAPPKQESSKPASTSKFSYTWAEFDIIRGDGTGYGDGPNGWDIHGSYGLDAPGLFIFGGVSHLSGNIGAVSPDTNTLTIGFGIHTPINPKTDFVADLSLKQANTESGAPSWPNDGTGYGIDVGVRHMASDVLEVNGGILFTDFDNSDSETTLHFGLVYYAGQNIGLVTNVSTSDDLEALTLGIRYTP